MITKSAEDSSKYTQNLFFTKNARTAWGHILFSLSQEGKNSVLLPSYIGFTEREGSGVFDPIQAHSINFKFYKLSPSLSIDLKDFEKSLASGEVSIALVIHYFGICQNNMDEIQRLCKKYDVVLIEDCAHAFHLGQNDQRLGNYGDFSFYSLHKYLATASGGVLKNNSSRVLPNLSDDQKIDIGVLEQYAKTEFWNISETRRKNFLAFQSYLSKINDLEVMFNLKDGEIPQSFPIKIKKNLREKLYFHLIDKKIPVTALYYRLIDQISKTDFPISLEISNDILNLPVHQDISEEGVMVICREIENFFNLLS